VIAEPTNKARAWTELLAAAVRSNDDRPVTIGLLPALDDGFTPACVADLLHMLVVHEYSQQGAGGRCDRGCSDLCRLQQFVRLRGALLKPT